MNFLTNDLRNDAVYESCCAAARRRVPVTQAVGVASRRAGRNIIIHKQLYFQVIDTVVALKNNRFEDVVSFSFLDLVNPKIFTKWQNGVPSEMLQKLSEKYGSLFHMSMVLKTNLYLFMRIRIF